MKSLSSQEHKSFVDRIADRVADRIADRITEQIAGQLPGVVERVSRSVIADASAAVSPKALVDRVLGVLGG